MNILVRATDIYSWRETSTNCVIPNGTRLRAKDELNTHCATHVHVGKEPVSDTCGVSACMKHSDQRG